MTITITGPSGCGKTTVAALIHNALQEVGQDAEYVADRRDMEERFRRIAPHVSFESFTRAGERIVIEDKD